MGDAPIGKRPMKRQVNVSGTIELSPKTLRVCLGHRGQQHQKITGLFERGGRWLPLRDHAKHLPKMFAANLASDIHNHLQQCEGSCTDGLEQSRSKVLVAGALPPCPKCEAKKENRSWTGPHLRETHDCLLKDDPRWTRPEKKKKNDIGMEENPPGLSSGSSSGSSSSASSSGSASSSSSSARPNDPGDRIAPKHQRARVKEEPRVADKKYAAIFLLSPEGGQFRTYLGRVSQKDNDLVPEERIGDFRPRWTPPYGVIEEGETGRIAAVRIAKAVANVSLNPDSVIFLRESVLDFGIGLHTFQNATLDFCARATPEIFASTRRESMDPGTNLIGGSV